MIRRVVIGMATTLKSLNEEYNNDSSSNSNSGFDVISKFVENHDINSQTKKMIKNMWLTPEQAARIP